MTKKAETSGWQGDVTRRRVRRKKRSERLNYEVRFLRSRWRFLADDGTDLYSNGMKVWVINHAAVRLNEAWRSLRVRSELTIKLKNGKIQDKRTFGDDPSEIKG